MKYKGIQACLWACCLLAAGTAVAQRKPLTYAPQGQEITAEQRLEQAGVRGMAVAVVLQGRLDTACHWGWADREHGQMVQANTLFQAGGLTATVTAIAALRAVAQGHIGLDDDVNRHLRTWKIPGRQAQKDPVTLRQLLTKQRGFTQFSKPEGHLPGTPLPTLAQLLEGEPPAQNAPVRLRSRTHRRGNYSFETELILQQLLEDIYRQPFARLMREQVLEPAGMNNSLFAAQLPDSLLQLAAAGYEQDGTRIPGGRWAYPELASSGLWTTASDFARLLALLMADAQDAGGRLLPQHLAQAAFHPENRSKTLAMNRYGLQGDAYYGGASRGFRTEFLLHPAQGWAYVVFMNSHENWPFMGETLHRLKIAFGTPMAN
jgi:CubicO group peptidase (beta-lactamase class C family)